MQYDVIVVGGGIHGAGVAQAAAAAGHTVLLLERTGPAHGTSSRSSKLIHGGLRYLETGQLHLVRESLRERELMLRNAPDLVRRVPFHIPVYATTRRRPWQIRIGLSLYALLGGFGRGTGFGTLPRRAWDSLDGLETRGLQCVLRYQDGQTDDRLLTRAILRSAEGLGAQLCMPAEFLSATWHARGVEVAYREAGGVATVAGRVLVNAGGPWAPQIDARVIPAPPPEPVELVQGSHLLLPGPLTRGIYYLESPQDGRVVFVMPWQGNTLVGTTETPFTGDPEKVDVLPAERDYLLNIAGHYFPRWRDPGVEPLHGFAGLRVLPQGDPGMIGSFTRSRETVLRCLPDDGTAPRLLGIYGGKLTGWRATAERVLDRLAVALPARRARADTRTIRLWAPD